ncbi:MAG TPA: Yip1 family protein [Anaerolineaceae bacterium]|nr:Yip1 family protein [Anaerolineaceae bacterium]
MTDLDLDLEVEEKPRKFTLQYLIPILIKPRKTLDEIVEKEHAVWIAPLVALMVTALILVLVQAPLIGMASQPAGQPEMYEYYSPEQQQQYENAVNMGSSPIITIIFPLVGKMIGIWIGWVLLGSILHLSLTLNGSRSSNRTALNVVAWSSVPFLLRDIVQIIAILITRQIIQQPGLSGFMAEGVTGFGSFLTVFLSFIDLYLIWQIVLIGLGAKRISGLKSSKSWIATMIAVIIFLVLKSIPGFIAAQLSGLSPTRMFF